MKFKKYCWLVAILAGLGLLLLVLYGISQPRGVEKVVDETQEAYILLSNGEQLDATVRFQGTLYIGSNKVDVDHFFGGVDGGIWINDTRVLQHYVFADSEHPVALGADNGYFYLSDDMAVFVARVNSELLKLDVEQQEVYIVLKKNTPAQYQPIFEAIQRREQ